MPLRRKCRAGNHTVHTKDGVGRLQIENTLAVLGDGGRYPNKGYKLSRARYGATRTNSHENTTTLYSSMHDTFRLGSALLNETIAWITDKDSFPNSNKYVLIAYGYRTGVGYCKNESWYHEDGGGVEGVVDAWANLPRGPYSEIDDRIDHTEQ